MPMAFAMTVLDRNGRLVYGMDYSMGHSLIKLIFLNLPHINEQVTNFIVSQSTYFCFGSVILLPKWVYIIQRRKV